MATESSSNLEEILERHKKENKQLQAEIQKLKHSVPKGDKKRKKEITIQIAQLQEEQDQRHQQEEEEANNLNKISEATNNLSNVTLNDSGDVTVNNETENQTEAIKSKKPSKAQKRRDKKAQQDRDREERIRQQDVENLTGPRHLEAQKLKTVLKERNLAIYQIPSDGNCLYAAIVDQLKRLSEQTSVEVLRSQAAAYLRQNQDDFLPFLCNQETGEPYTIEQYEEYCHKLEQTAEWGGQLELRALANVLYHPIEVIQADAPVIILGEEYEGKRLILSYHRFAYGLGEHYNSVVDKALIPDSEDEEGFT